ncbi:MAG: helix-turn-helix transcriptional regulator [Lachnospiraceae bacterium]|nr:helix-turn-helix transcriptional regulator [Lachnospiraceae bacterium]
MNERFITIIKNKAKSQYELAQRSGVPYSTINGLMKKKHEVNKCGASTLLKIAKATGVEIGELLDPYPVMDRMAGEYRNIHYHWNWNGKTMEVSFRYHGEDVTLDTKNKLHFPDKIDAYRFVAEMEIDEFLSNFEFEEEAGAYYGKLFSQA